MLWLLSARGKIIVKQVYWHRISIGLARMLLPLPANNCALQWCYNERDGVSHHPHHDCLLNRLFRRRSKKTSKLRVTGLCEVNSPVTGEFPAQRASKAESVFHLMTSSCKPVMLKINNASNTWVLCLYLQSLRVGDAYIRPRDGSTLLQLLAWCMIGAKPIRHHRTNDS